MYKDEFLKREKVIPLFSLRCEADINCLDCDLEDIANFKISEVPTWTSKSPTYLHNLASDKKAITDPVVFKTKFLEVKEQYYTHEIYTDGSKDCEKVASAAILDGELYQFRLPNNSSIFYAELKAIDFALKHIKQDAFWRYIILTDSLAAMQALEGEKTDNPLIVNLLEKLSRLGERGDIVFFCWLLSHIGRSGNEEADKAAKDALSLEMLPVKVPPNDFKPLINYFIQNVWQQSWSNPANQNNKLFTIKPGLGEWLPGLRINRREEIILARLHIGHSYITHSCLLKGEEEPQ